MKMILPTTSENLIVIRYHDVVHKRHDHALRQICVCGVRDHDRDHGHHLCAVFPLQMPPWRLTTTYFWEADRELSEAPGRGPYRRYR